MREWQRERLHHHFFFLLLFLFVHSNRLVLARSPFFSSSVARHTHNFAASEDYFIRWRCNVFVWFDAVCAYVRCIFPSSLMHFFLFLNSGWFDWPMGKENGNENDVKSKIIASEINCVASSHLCVCMRLRRDGIRHLIIGSVTVIRSSCSFRLSGCRLTSPWLHTDAHTAYNFTIMRCQTIDRTIKTIKQKKKTKTTRKNIQEKL